MSFDTTRSELESLFSEVGEFVEVFLPTDRATGRPRGFAFVEFKDQAAAEEAIRKFDGLELQGRQIRVNEAEERRPRVPSFSDGGYSPGPTKARRGKPKGSRRNLRRKKRGF